WVLFFDGSKSAAATGPVGCRLSDRHLVTLGGRETPSGGRGEGGGVDRLEVGLTVRRGLSARTGAAMFADPPPAADDAGSGFWDAVMDGWQRDFGDRLSLWAVQSGPNRHSIMWDMSSPSNHRLFVQAAEAFATELEQQYRGRQMGVPVTLTFDGHPKLVAHLKNAREFPTKWGVSLMKEHRQSARKIDLAVCAVGARMLRRLVLNRGLKDQPPSVGTLW